MPIDTSISRVSSSDSTSALIRKKSKADAIEVSKLSFLNNLLSISQFESTIPDGAAFPPGPQVVSDATQVNESSYDQVDNTSGEQPEEDESIEDASNVATDQLIVQQQVVVQPTLQTTDASVKADNSDKTDHTSPIQGTAKQTQVQQGVTNDTPNETNRIDSDAGKTSSDKDFKTDLQKAHELSTQSDIDTNVLQDSLQTDVESQIKDDEGRNPLLSTDDTSKSKPIQKGRASADSSDNDKDESKAGLDIASLTAVKSDNKDASLKTRIETQPSEEQVNPTNEFDESAFDADQPRNRRSERLAELASSNDSTSDERDESSESSQNFDFNVATVAALNDRDDSFLSATTVSTPLPPATPITPSYSPALPSLNTFNNASSSAATNVRSTLDGVSAVTASATSGVSPTGTSNTTISGTTPTSSRSDAARSEAARPNSGSPLSAYQEGKLVQRVLRGVEQLANGGGQVRLRLHPAQLGSLQISLKIEAGQVSAKLEVENATARDALLNNVQTLKDRLAEQGIKVASFEVEVSTDSTGSGTANSSFQGDGRSSGQAYRDNAESRFAQQNSNRLTSDAVPPAKNPPVAWARNTGSLDLTV